MKHAAAVKDPGSGIVSWGDGAFVCDLAAPMAAVRAGGFVW